MTILLCLCHLRFKSLIWGIICLWYHKGLRWLPKWVLVINATILSKLLPGMLISPKTQSTSHQNSESGNRNNYQPTIMLFFSKALNKRLATCINKLCVSLLFINVTNTFVLVWRRRKMRACCYSYYCQFLDCQRLFFYLFVCNWKPKMPTTKTENHFISLMVLILLSLLINNFKRECLQNKFICFYYQFCCLFFF